ncbi:MAG: kinase, partial [Kiritimatiellia bacterium]|nr:kinase [Kiritimatiellia bacterium]
AMIISRTPFRISLFVGGSEFPEFYKYHPGSTLSTTIDKYCYISLHYLLPFFNFKFRASYSKTEAVNQASDFKHPLIRECLLHLPVEQALEIAHVSDLPGRTGLGTSSSFTVGLLNALHAIRGENVSAEKLAQEAILIERERVGDMGGHQDQYAAAYGGFLRVDYQGTGTRLNRLDFPTPRLAELKQYLQLFFMGTERTSASILLDQKKRTKLNIGALKQMAEMAVQAQKILESKSDLRQFGELLNEAWKLKKGLANGISNETIDRIYEAAKSAGALGGKLLGAGGCGFILLFVPPENQPKVCNQLKHLKEVSFSFSNEGSRIIFKDP